MRIKQNTQIIYPFWKPQVKLPRLHLLLAETESLVM